ncbi:MAG: DMT family transporter [Bryobacterales bacterium]|nr:DMT family transporter [Bryobacterales bacterium]
MVLVWSANFVVAKNALSQFSPLMLGALRFTCGGLFILPIYLWRKRGQPLPDLRASWKVLGIGLLGVGLNQFLFLLGLVRTTVAHSAILIAMTPMMVLLLSAWVGHERITRTKLVGLALAMSGVGVLQGRALLGGHGSMLGDLFVLLAGLTFAMFTVAGKEIRERYDGLTINTFAYTGSAVLLAPVTLWLAAGTDFSRVRWTGWLSVVYMAIFPSVIAYLIFYHALRFMPSSQLSRLAYLQPFLATCFAVPLLGERVTPSLVAGGALVLAGVFWTERT